LCSAGGRGFRTRGGPGRGRSCRSRLAAFPSLGQRGRRWLGFLRLARGRPLGGRAGRLTRRLRGRLSRRLRGSLGSGSTRWLLGRLRGRLLDRLRWGRLCRLRWPGSARRRWRRGNRGDTTMLWRGASGLSGWNAWLRGRCPDLSGRRGRLGRLPPARDHAKQPDCLAPTLRTTVRLRGPPQLVAAVGAAKGFHRGETCCGGRQWTSTAAFV